MSRAERLYGTDQPQPERVLHALTPWSFTYEAGALRHIHLHGIEAIRGIAFLVRDRDWGTVMPQLHNERLEVDETTLRLSYDALYETAEAQLHVTIEICVTPNTLTMSALGKASGRFETNRAGFTVLHPINGVAGQPVQVTHSDGLEERAVFPLLIAPWQPFQDITALTHRVGDAQVTCLFEGDIFEMEDQRQWGDASFKTYNRPLAKPWPYEIADGEALQQSVTLRWSATVPARPQDAASASPMTPSPTTAIRFPDTALVITPQEAQRLQQHPEDLALVQPQRLLCHLDSSLGGTEAQFASFAAVAKIMPNMALDLELICRFDTEDPEPELQALAGQMAAAGLSPASVMVCPSVDRQSTPPGSLWPECPPLALIHGAAARVFGEVPRGGGMVSFFPELNRKRPPVDMLDFVSHGLCPIVHAADDTSVMETLEAVPHITRSARAIIGARGYRIGPSTIAMRQNPYGSRTLPNPVRARVCMADDDPRHRAEFAAAYVIGLATALAPADVAVWTPAALYGPRGVMAEQGTWPVTRALAALSSLAGQSVHRAEITEGLAHLDVGESMLRANLTAEARAGLAPFEWRHTTARDAD